MPAGEATAATETLGADTYHDTALKVVGLSVDIDTDSGPLRVVDGVSFEVRKGEVMGLVGESGSGKSITALSILRLLPDRARVTAGAVDLAGSDLLAMNADQLRSVRGRRVSMVFQDPLTSLNPLMTVDRQLVEAYRLHDKTVSKASARRYAGDLLSTVGFSDPTRVLRSYPHELSGGMRQRVMIVMAMANRPELLIADEPTTALDVTTQAQVLDSLAAAREAVGSAMLLISHDLGPIGERADRVHVMYGGRIVEAGRTAGILERPAHPYTVGLLESRPTLDRRRRLRPIPGSPPSQFDVVDGCAFAPRCGRSEGRKLCLSNRPVLVTTPGRPTAAACHFADEASGSGNEYFELPARETLATAEIPASQATSLLGVDGLVKVFGRRGRLLARRSPPTRAVDEVSFCVEAGRTLALVGESGSGKSTVARTVLRLVEPTSGSIVFEGQDVMALSGSHLRRYRTRAQLVQQDPYSALNPRMTVGEAIGEPLRVHGAVSRAAVERRVGELLESVGLRPEHSRRFPHEFSGGQRQRVCIARALSLEPQLLVLDEPVSSLDVSIQAQILNLLADLQVERNIAYLFITHDLAVVRNVADDIAVLYRGKVVEAGPADTVLANPAHDYTRALIAAVPNPRHRRADSGGRL